MAWIELHQAVWTHRKTWAMADELGVPPAQVVMHLAALWCWAVDSAPAGDLGGVRPGSIARAAQWDGDAQTFITAAVAAGYLDADEDGLRLHDWMDYAGRLIEQRVTDRDRQRAAREKKRQEKLGGRASTRRPSDVHRMSSGPSTDVRVTSDCTQSNPTVPRQNQDTEQRARVCEENAVPSEKTVVVAGGDTDQDASPRLLSEGERAFAAAEQWVSARLRRLALKPHEWPILTAQLAAVDGDVAQYQRVVEAVLAQHPEETVGHVRYFDHAFAAFRATHQLPQVVPRASPAAAVLREDPTVDEYRAMAAAQAAAHDDEGGGA